MKNRDKEFQNAFGKHVKRLREEKDWSQEQLAAQARMEVNQISRIENGRHAANMHTIKSIAVALGKYPDELLRFKFEIALNTDFNARHRRNKRVQTTSILSKLVDTDFLDSPKSVAQIIAKCKLSYDVELKSSATSGALKKLIDNRVLKRVKSSEKKSNFVYQKRIK